MANTKNFQNQSGQRISTLTPNFPSQYQRNMQSSQMPPYNQFQTNSQFRPQQSMLGTIYPQRNVSVYEVANYGSMYSQYQPNRYPQNYNAYQSQFNYNRSQIQQSGQQQNQNLAGSRISQPYQSQLPANSVSQSQISQIIRSSYRQSIP